MPALRRRVVPAVLAAAALSALAIAQDSKPAQPTAKPGEMPADAKAAMEAYNDASKPTAAHAKLAAFVGDWDMTTRAWVSPGAPPVEMKGTVKKSWAFGERYLKEEVAGVDPMGQPYTGVGYVGFDPGMGQYQGVWIASSSASMLTYAGTSDDGKTFTFTGKESDPMSKGVQIDFKMTVTVDSPDKHTLTMHYIVPGAGEMKAFEIVHTRKK